MKKCLVAAFVALVVMTLGRPAAASAAAVIRSSQATPSPQPVTRHTYLWARTASGGPLPACSAVPETSDYECVPDPTQPICTITFTASFTATAQRGGKVAGRFDDLGTSASCQVPTRFIAVQTWVSDYRGVPQFGHPPGDYSKSVPADTPEGSWDAYCDADPCLNQIVNDKLPRETCAPCDASNQAVDGVAVYYQHNDAWFRFQDPIAPLMYVTADGGAFGSYALGAAVYNFKNVCTGGLVVADNSNATEHDYQCEELNNISVTAGDHDFGDYPGAQRNSEPGASGSDPPHSTAPGSDSAPPSAALIGIPNTGAAEPGTDASAEILAVVGFALAVLRRRVRFSTRRRGRLSREIACRS